MTFLMFPFTKSIQLFILLEMILIQFKMIFHLVLSPALHLFQLLFITSISIPIIYLWLLSMYHSHLVLLCSHPCYLSIRSTYLCVIGYYLYCFHCSLCFVEHLSFSTIFFSLFLLDAISFFFLFFVCYHY